MASQIEFRLHITGPEFERDFVIPMGETLIGRDPSSGLPLVYPLVSRRHARLDCSETACTITDLESANGTIVNGERLNPNEPMSLADGMHITIGPFEINCTMTDQVGAVPAASDESAAEEQPPAEETPQAAESKEEQPPAKPAGKEPAAQEPVKKPSRPTKARQGAEKPAAKEPAQDKKPEAEPQAALELTEPPDELLPELPARLQPIPGLSLHSQSLIDFLPGIYATDFMSRFLGLFESILTPIEWNVDNFDMFLDPGTSPLSFLPWLAGWYEIVYDVTWSESQRRTLLKEAYQIYARRGTRWSLGRLIEIYTGSLPEIVEFSDPKDPFTFTIKLSLRERDVNRQLLENLIDQNKPAQSSYILEFRS